MAAASTITYEPLVETKLDERQLSVLVGQLDMNEPELLSTIDYKKAGLSCTVCLTISTEMRETICNHLICTTCESQLPRVEPLKIKCPICRNTTTTKLSVVVNRLVQLFTSKCVHPSCTWKGDYGSLSKHRFETQIKRLRMDSRHLYDTWLYKTNVPQGLRRTSQ